MKKKEVRVRGGGKEVGVMTMINMGYIKKPK